jgi:(S)-ureidoglycine aminohydrolase
MKRFFFCVACILLASLPATQASGQLPPVASGVYSWKNLPAEKKQKWVKRQVLQGSGAALQQLEIYTVTLEPGASAHESQIYNREELIIVKEGSLRVTIKDQTRTLGPGSTALAMPGDQHGFENAGKTRAIYYLLKYKSKDSADMSRASGAGGSFMVNWNDIAFKPHDKGGRRDFFERPTAMTRRFEMHVTTLNAGLKSHDPHRHKAEEIVLLIEGNAEMQIGKTMNKARPGDLIYLGSNVLHALRNVGTKPCTYFAFQWE